MAFPGRVRPQLTVAAWVSEGGLTGLIGTSEIDACTVSEHPKLPPHNLLLPAFGVIMRGPTTLGTDLAACDQEATISESSVGLQKVYSCMGKSRCKSACARLYFYHSLHLAAILCDVLEPDVLSGQDAVHILDQQSTSNQAISLGR